MEFKTLSIVKHPRQLVWETMRDHFPDIVEFVDEVDSITEESRIEIPSGELKILNVWKANPKLPDVLVKHMNAEMFTWTDTAIWDEKNMICNWTIDSHYFKEKMQCKGLTKFETAIGGRGCRMTFAGSIHWDGEIPLTFGMMDGMVSNALESIISKMVPNNFRKLTIGVEAYIKTR